MGVEEITLNWFNSNKFINEKVGYIKSVVEDDGVAINALSGGVDSSVVTMLGHLALEGRLKTYFVDNGIMREGEPQRIVSIFKDLGVNIELIDAQDKFFEALKGITNPEEKREAVTQTFYKDVFAELVEKTGAKYLFQGTILTDVDETKAKIKRQHNVFKQIGIDPEKAFGYKILEPLEQLRKPSVRVVAKKLKLPKEIIYRQPFPGPALATRVVGEITREKINTVRKATSIVEYELSNVKAFQYMAILHEDKVTGMRDGKRDFGLQIEVRCWDSKDARIASPTRLPYKTLENLAGRLTEEVPGVVSVTYNITTKPPSTIEII